MADVTDKVAQLEDEVKILKNEIQAVLLDLRESYLNLENPISRELPPFPEQHVVVSSPLSEGRPGPHLPGAGSHPDPAGRATDPQALSAETAELSASSRGMSENSLAPDALYEPQPDGPRIPPHGFQPGPDPFRVDEAAEAGAEDGPARGPGPGPEPEPAGRLESPAPESGPEVAATETTAREEVTRVWRPVSDMAQLEAPCESTGNGGASIQIDLATITSLADWMTDVVKRLGSERAESILDICEMVGFIDPDLKDLLARFVFPNPGEKEGKVTTRDYLISLKELDRIIGKATRFELALLSILCQGNDGG